MKSYSESYKAAGVDITAGYRAVELMKQHIARTMTPGVVSDIGGFGGLLSCRRATKSRCSYRVRTASARSSS